MKENGEGGGEGGDWYVHPFPFPCIFMTRWRVRVEGRREAGGE